MSDDLKVVNIGHGGSPAADGFGGMMASTLLNNGFNTDVMRPYVDPKTNQGFVNNGKSTPRLTNNAILLKDEWIALETSIIPVARQRMRFVSDLVSMGMVRDLPNGLGTSQYQYQTSSDISDATVSMSPINKGLEDLTEYNLNTLPIPLVMKPFRIDIRQLATYRKSGVSVDTWEAEQCSIKVAEAIEKLHLGTYGSYKFGGADLYGLRNFDDRITATYSDWTAGAKTAKQRANDILGFINTLRTNKQYGPFGIYYGSNLERYFDEDYNDSYGVLTLRERILKIGADKESADPGDVSSSIRFIRALDYLENDDIIVVSFGNRSIRSLRGMSPRIIQWNEEGGLVVKFVVMAIQLPLIQKDYNDKVGILHATKV